MELQPYQALICMHVAVTRPEIQQFSIFYCAYVAVYRAGTVGSSGSLAMETSISVIRDISLNPAATKDLIMNSF